MQFNLDKSLSTSDLKTQICLLPIDKTLKEIVNSAFRVRIKYKEGYEQNQLQIRIKPVEIDPYDLEEYRLVLQKLTKPFGIDYVVLEYQVCCMTGCNNCTCFFWGVIVLW
jgi:hypothetical protein